MRKASLLIAVLCLSYPAAADPPKLPDGPGKATVEKVCGNCHGVEVAISRRESKDGWNAIIDDMIQRGAQATDDEFGEVSDYLAANFSKSTPGGKLNVNNATAKEIAAALEISDEQGAAVVKYRQEKGNFKSAADLEKVPGLDAAKVEAKRANLTFTTH